MPIKLNWGSKLELINTKKSCYKMTEKSPFFLQSKSRSSLHTYVLFYKLFSTKQLTLDCSQLSYRIIFVP